MNMWFSTLVVVWLCLIQNRAEANQHCGKLEEEIKLINMKIYDMDQKSAYQDLQIKHLLETVARQDEKMMSLKVDYKQNKRSEITYAKSAFGCEAQNVSLACSENKTIFINRADYGEYITTCPENTCCLPYPTDCTELLSENDPAEWITLKTLCDNTSSCNYLFRGAIFIDDCGTSEAVDYINIYYTCLPENLDAPVAFNAYATVDREYGDYELVIFDSTFLNYGEHYQTHNSVFICPVNGLYAFSVNVVSTSASIMTGRIAIENDLLTGFQSGKDDDSEQTGSTFAIVECFIGQRVWVRTSGGPSHFMSGDYARSSFSGFLLHGY